MKPTALDPQTALVAIDLQKGITRLPTIHPTVLVVANVGPLSPDYSELEKALDQQANDILITKRQWGVLLEPTSFCNCAGAERLVSCWRASLPAWA
jgi:hypothetical protein